MKIMIAGGTGFIGGELVSELRKKDHEVFLLSRSQRKSADPKIHYLPWDGESVGLWAKEMGAVNAVINLAGEPIAQKRWSPAQKNKIVQSRLLATRAIVEAISKSDRKPKVLINASAVGYYGDVSEGEVSETHPKGSGFLAETCDAWEKEVRAAEALGLRTVCLRIGVVLERGGGALSKMLTPFQMFAGGPLGSGKQWFAWIHREDVVRIILFALENESLSGAVNTTAPNPVTMSQFCHELGKVLQRPSWAPVPAFVLKMLLGEMSEMLLGGQKAVPAKLLKHGFVFKFPVLKEALSDILGSK